MQKPKTVNRRTTFNGEKENDKTTKNDLQNTTH